MSSLVKDQTEGYWQLSTSPYKIQDTDTVTFTLDTENKFVDADIVIKVKADAASSLSLNLTDLTSNLTMGSASNGVYSPTVSLTGTVSAGTAGWFTSGSVTDSSVAIGKINQSVLQNGGTTISNNTTIVPTSSQQTITITEGYNTARTLIIDSTSSATAAVITSGSATVSSLSYTYVAASGNDLAKFTISGSADVSAPTVGTAGYISSGASGLTANTGGATVNASVNAIELGVNITGTALVTPIISKNNATNCAAAGSATTTQPLSGYYIAVASAQNKNNIMATPIVTLNGYGTTDYTGEVIGEGLFAGANASATTYIPITSATFANAGTTNVTYTDISSSVSPLVSGDYLYINEGYTGNQKISLAKLVPDATGTNASASYVLSGYTAYNNDGALIVGTMQTYNGSYTIV